MILYDDVALMKKLAHKLNQIDFIGKHRDQEPPEAETLAYSFSEFEMLFARYLNEILPELVKEETPIDRIDDLLIEFMIDLNSIVSQVAASRTYRGVLRRFLDDLYGMETDFDNE